MEEHNTATGDIAQNPLGNFRRGKLLPIQTVHIPLDRLHPDGANRADHIIIIVAIGTAVESGFLASDLLNLLVAPLQLLYDGLAAALRQVRVGVGMIFDLMPCIGQCFHRFRVLIHPLADQEKGRLHLIFPQYFNQLFRILIPPGECFFAAADDRALLATLAVSDILSALPHRLAAGARHRPLFRNRPPQADFSRGGITGTRYRETSQTVQVTRLLAQHVSLFPPSSASVSYIQPLFFLYLPLYDRK